MNRRKAIYSILVLGGGAAATYTGFKYYNINKEPNLAYLDDNALLIDELSGIIIPTTNTPGAKDVEAYKFIITLVKEVADTKTQNNFIDGLKDMKQYSHQKFDKPFLQLTGQQKQQVLKYFYEEGENFSGKLGKARNKLLGKSFFDILREYTTIAFCTSQKGATQALAYNYIPGQYKSCIPLQKGQASWATK